MAQITREKKRDGTVSIRVRAQLPNRLKYRNISQVGLTRYTKDESKIPALVKVVEARRRELVAVFDADPHAFTDHEMEQKILNNYAAKHHWGVAKPVKHNFAFRWSR